MHGSMSRQKPSAADRFTDPAGDDDLRRFVRKEAPRLHRVLMFLVRDSEVATNVMRESFLAVLRSGVLDTQAAIRLYSIAVEGGLRCAAHGESSRGVGSIPRLFEALEGLSSNQHVFIALCDVGGMSTVDASRVLGMSREDFRSELHRARTELCRRLHPSVQDDR